MRAEPFGDRAIEIVAEDAAHARRIARAVARLDGVIEAVVGFDRVVAMVDSLEVLGAIRAVDALPEDDLSSGAEHLIRAIYDGPDLREVAEASGLSVEDVARCHAAPTYVVEVVGFLPGFAYLGGVDRKIARPRRNSPRPRVEARSIGIAGERTAIYPLPSPGGWNLIGRALDVTPFDPLRTPPSILAVGDRVRFEVVDVAR